MRWARTREETVAGMRQEPGQVGRAITPLPRGGMGSGSDPPGRIGRAWTEARRGEMGDREMKPR